jgi:hypothetical protein
LAFGVLGYLWLLVLRPTGEPDSSAVKQAVNQQISLAFIYLQFLMILILGHFFAAHGNTIGKRVSYRSPLGLPSGSVRLLLLAGYLGQAVYLYRTHAEFELPKTGDVVILLLVMISAFMLGYFLTHLIRAVSGGTLPAWAQDMQAWFALLALVVLGLILLVRLVINPGVSEMVQIPLDQAEAVLAGLVGFYFGARS